MPSEAGTDDTGSTNAAEAGSPSEAQEKEEAGPETPATAIGEGMTAPTMPTPEEGGFDGREFGMGMAEGAGVVFEPATLGNIGRGLLRGMFDTADKMLLGPIGFGLMAGDAIGANDAADAVNNPDPKAASRSWGRAAGKLLSTVALIGAGGGRGGGGRRSGPVGELRAAGLKDAHHTIQDAAVRDLPNYDPQRAPGVHLEGPANVAGSPHGRTRAVQRQHAGDGPMLVELDNIIVA